ncbi:MAG: redox-regulated ATPase YchF [Pseudomonadota bacterium]
MHIGIIGLPNSGKTTVFNALTRGKAETSAFSSGKIEVHTATVDVPDPRVDALAAMFRPRKVTRAQVRYVDIAGLARGIGEKGALDGGLLTQISQADALLHVVRAFEDPEVIHIEDSVEPRRDVDILDTELMLSDLGIVERRLERVDAGLAKRGLPVANQEALAAERERLVRFQAQIEAGRSLRDLPLETADAQLLRNIALAMAKPLLVVLNTGEQAAASGELLPDYRHQSTVVTALRGKLEMELAQMEAEEAAEFLAEYGIEEPGLNRVVRLSHGLLGLMSFFTVGEDEVRAWTVPVGAKAVEAAGAIHSDLARGFIRAEVVAYADLIAAGGLVEAKKRGTVRLEGKGYVVEDGDVLNIRFNV